MTEGALEMMNRVSEANDGVHVCPVDPHLVFSTDDTTQYVYRYAGKHGIFDKIPYIT